MYGGGGGGGDDGVRNLCSKITYYVFIEMCSSLSSLSECICVLVMCLSSTYSSLNL